MKKSQVKRRNVNCRITNIGAIDSRRMGPCDDGLRILARMIARAYLRDSQFKGKESDNNSESKTK